jgi:hypothetical protein
MLENKELLIALIKNMATLRLRLNNYNVEIAETSQLDIFYTDGSASGSLFKILPYGFYYNYKGELYFAGLTYDYKTYGCVIEEWIASIRGGDEAAVEAIAAH